MAALTKLGVARYQLGTALDLFIRDKDPVSVQCLACGGSELIDAIANLENIKPFAAHALRTVPNLDQKGLRDAQRLYWNAFKHMSDKRGNARDDADVLSSFDDSRNDAALFVGWSDYGAVAKRLPVAAQVFQLWWYATNETKLSSEADLEAIRSAFPNIASATRAEQKRLLRRKVEKYRNNAELLGDSRTEKLPLCLPTSPHNN